LPLLVSVEATGVCVLTDNSEILFAAKFLCHSVPLITLLWEMVTYSTSSSIRISDCQAWSFLISYTQIIYQQYSTYWITLKLRTFWNQLKNSWTGNVFKPCLWFNITWNQN
jgi:hypothetical protein